MYIYFVWGKRNSDLTTSHWYMSLRYGQCFTVGWLDRVFFIYVTIYCRGFLLTSIDSSLTPGSMIWLSPIVEQNLGGHSSPTKCGCRWLADGSIGAQTTD